MRSFLLFFSLIIFCSCSAQNERPILIESIPFELIDDTILIRLKVNDIENQIFVFDTGAGGTLISKSLGDNLKLKNGSSSINTGAAGTHKVDVYQNNIITIGKTQIRNIPLIKDRKDFNFRSSQEPINGIIGYDVLSNYVTRINYSKSQMELYAFDGFNASNFGAKYNISIMQNIPFIEVNDIKIGKESFDGKMLVDTGAQPNLIFNTPFVKKNNLENKISKSFSITRLVGTSNSKKKIIICKVREINLFNSMFLEIPAALSTGNKGAQNNNRYQGIIGNGILKRFDITINYSKKEMFVKANRYFNDEFKMNCFGVLFKRDLSHKKLVIEEFVDNSAADLSDLEIGDEIIEIDGISVSMKSSLQLRKIFSQKNKEIEIKYVRGDGVYKTRVILKEMI